MPVLLILTFFFISNVAALGITAQPAAIVGQASLVFWSLQPSDGSNALTFDLRFVRPGPQAKDVGLAVANINASPSIPYGIAQIVFPSPGPYELVAVRGPDSINLGTSNQVNVIPMQTTTSQPIPSATTTAHLTSTASGVHRKNLGAIIGGTLGGVAFLGILAALVIFFLRRRRSTGDSNRRWTFYRDRMVRPANADVNPMSPTQASCPQDIEHGSPEDTDPSEGVMIASPNGPRPLLKYRPLPLPPAPLTERQKAVVKQMEELRDQMMELERNAGPTQHIMLDDLQKHMRWLEGQVGSAWAMGLTDVMPLGFSHNLAP